MKKFIMCVVMMAVCSTANASIDSSNKYEIVYKYKVRKPIRKIIREILNRKQIENIDVPNTIPIPLYDSIKPNRLKDVA